MPNPLRSEADAFRWIVVIGIAAASVIAVALLTRPAVGVAWAATLIGFGTGFAWRALSAGSAGGGLPLGAGERRRALVLADDGVDSATLLAQLEARGIGAGEVFLVAQGFEVEVGRALGVVVIEMDGRHVEGLTEPGLGLS